MNTDKKQIADEELQSVLNVLEMDMNKNYELIIFTKELMSDLEYEKRFCYEIYTEDDVREVLNRNKQFYLDILKSILSTTPKNRLDWYKNRNRIEKALSFLADKSLSLKRESYDVIQEWVNDADKHLKRSKNAIDTEQAFEESYLAVEKLVKAHGLLLGIKTEKELISIKHIPGKMYLDLLQMPESSIATEIFGLKIEKQNIEKLKDLTKLSDEKCKEELFKLDNSTQLFISNYTKMLNIVEKLLEEKNIKEIFKESKNYDVELSTSSLLYVSLGFSGLLLPLSMSMSVYYDARYIDKKRKLPIKIDQLNLTKNMNVIRSLLEKNIENFNILINAMRKINCRFLLEELLIVYFKEGLETDKSELVKKIKADPVVNRIIEKIKTHKKDK